jgi:uncharacterized integral membrane protein
MSDGESRAQRVSRHRGPSSRLIAGGVLAIVAVVLIVQNTMTVDIRLLVPVLTMPLWVALAVVLIIGALIGALWTYRR